MTLYLGKIKLINTLIPEQVSTTLFPCSDMLNSATQLTGTDRDKTLFELGTQFKRNLCTQNST